MPSRDAVAGADWGRYRDGGSGVCRRVRQEAATEGEEVKEFKWKHNGLRHSFISYRVAVIKNVAQVALEAGNSPAMIFSNYRELVTPQDAKAWFGIVPPGSNGQGEEDRAASGDGGSVGGSGLAGGDACPIRKERLSFLSRSQPSPRTNRKGQRLRFSEECFRGQARRGPV